MAAGLVLTTAVVCSCVSWRRTLPPSAFYPQGYLVGNGCTDQAYDGNAQVPFAVGKSLISTSLYRRTQAACGGSYWDAKEGSRCVLLCVWRGGGGDVCVSMLVAFWGASCNAANKFVSVCVLEGREVKAPACAGGKLRQTHYSINAPQPVPHQGGSGSKQQVSHLFDMRPLVLCCAVLPPPLPTFSQV